MKTALYIIRTRCNYSQVMVANELQVSRQMVHAWEIGTKAVPKGRIEELSKLFGVPADILMEVDTSAVEHWCNRPLFSLKKHGKQVFSFSSNGDLEVFISSPGAPMPDNRCKELTTSRNEVIKILSQQTGFNPETQAQEIDYVESCLSSLMSISMVFQTAAQADHKFRQQILDFLAEQIHLVAEVLTGEVINTHGDSEWRTLQILQLKTHWAAITRERAERERALLLEEAFSFDPSQCLEEMIEQWYRQAMQQGVGYRELQERINRFLQEDYYHETN